MGLAKLLKEVQQLKQCGDMIEENVRSRAETIQVIHIYIYIHIYVYTHRFIYIYIYIYILLWSVLLCVYLHVHAYFIFIITIQSCTKKVCKGVTDIFNYLRVTCWRVPRSSRDIASELSSEERARA